MSLKEDGLGNGNQPIFIHSLWRSGSTYMFDVFRNSGHGFTCYQEALHEWALFGIDQPERLLDIDVVDDLMRHPVLDKPYFQELYDALPNWSNAINKDYIYGNYFSGEGIDEYFNSLIKASPNRPVFQEVRTGGRIEFLKDKIGGLHIYLWRNPRDQFWSFLKSKYFKSALLMILNYNRNVPILEKIKKVISFKEFYCRDILGEFEYFNDIELSYENFYEIYFTIWCIYQINARKHCDIIIDMNKLSSCEAYRYDIIESLKFYGIEKISFDECKMPRFAFKHKEIIEFSAIENEIFDSLIVMNYSGCEISMLKSLIYSSCDEEEFQRDSVGHQLVDLRHMVRDNMNRASKQFTQTLAAVDTSIRTSQMLADERESFDVRLKSAVDDRDSAIIERDQAVERLKKLAADYEKSLNAAAVAQQEELDRLWQAHNSRVEVLQNAARAREGDLQNKIALQARDVEQLQISLQHNNEIWENERNEMSGKMADMQSMVINIISHIEEGRVLLSQQKLFRHGLLYRWLWRRGKKWPSVDLERQVDRWLTIAGSLIAFQPGSISIEVAMNNNFTHTDPLVGYGNPYLRVNSVSELCAWHDRDFVRCAFVTILGRQPDVEGELHYVRRLREGVHKLSIIRDLCASDEARGHAHGIVNLDNTLRRYRYKQLPVVSTLLRLLGQQDGNDGGSKRLRAMQNDIGRLIGQLVRITSIVENDEDMDTGVRARAQVRQAAYDIGVANSLPPRVRELYERIARSY